MIDLIDYLKDQHDDLEKRTGNYKIFSCDPFPTSAIVYGSTGKENSTKIHADLLPQPVVGDLKNAKIIICSLNPGYCDEDYYVENLALAKLHGYPYYRDILLDQLDQSKNNTFFWLTESPKKSGGAKWWQGRLDQNNPKLSLVNNIFEAYKKNGVMKKKEEVWEMLSRIMAAIELFPYHSKSMDKNLLKSCRSVEVVRDYVLDDLIPRAKKEDRLICFTRSFKEWGVAKKKLPPNVIINKSVRNISFSVKSHLGRAIFDHIEKLSNQFTKKL